MKNKETVFFDTDVLTYKTNNNQNNYKHFTTFKLSSYVINILIYN